MPLHVAFESSRASFPVAAECRVKWIDMHYLIICLLCTLLLEARSSDLLLAHNAHLLVPVQGGTQVGADAFIHETFMNCHLKARHYVSERLGFEGIGKCGTMYPVA